MRVFILRADSNHYQNLVFQSDDYYDLLDRFDGRPLLEVWKPPAVKILRNDQFNRNLSPSDFPSLATHVPIFSSRALGVLKGMLQENGEILPLDCDEGEYFAFNITRVVAALDESASKITRFKSSGRIMDIHAHCFLDGALKGVVIFKIPEVPLMNVYVTDIFYESVAANRLHGFRFEKVWQS